MRTFASQLWLMGSIALASVLFAAELRAQVIPDGTTGTNVACTPLCTITGGTTAGRNLFHSFDQFSIPSSGAAFNNAPTIENIFSRVTGRLPSNINGVLRANGTANVFLINPNGIIFGPRARLSIGGSFLATSADSVLFNDGFAFSASNPQTPPILNVNTPVGLQFGDRSGSIAVNGARLSLRIGRTLALVGNGITVSPTQDASPQTTVLSVRGGRIELGSVANNSLVDLIPGASGFVLSYGDWANSANISITGRSLVSVGGLVSRGIGVFGREVRLAGRSQLFESFGSGIDIKAVDLYLLNEALIATETLEPRRGSNINIQAENVFIRNSAGIETSTRGSGGAGDVTVTATNRISIDEETNRNRIPSRISSDVELGAEGNGGEVRIQTRYLDILNGGNLTSGTLGSGNSGNVIVLATDSVNVIGRSPAGSSDAVNVDDDGSLPSLLGTQVERPALRLAPNFLFGNGGDVRIETPRLTVSGGATVTARSFGFGRSDAGNITIIAPEQVIISGIYRTLRGGDRRSGIATQVGRRRGGDPIEGNAGNLRIESDRLVIQDGGILNSRNSGPGNAGSIEVVASGIELDRGGTITSEMFGGLSTGNAGNLLLRAREMTLNNASLITASTITPKSAGGNIDLQVTDSLRLSANSNIRTTTENGQGGNLRLNSRQQATRLVTLSGGSSLSAQAQAQGNAGNIFMNVGRLWVNHPNSSIAASSVSREGGDIRIAADRIFVQNRAKISASTELGRGGNVALSGLQLLQVNRGGQISASTNSGQGGNVTVDSNTLRVDNGEITASATTGRAGLLSINAADLVELLNRGSLSVRATQRGSSAGDLSIQTGQFLVQNGAEVSVSAPLGVAGNLAISANLIRLDSGKLTAITGAIRGGNIQLQDLNFLLMRNGSQISADARNNANGGNIAINSNFIVAVPQENSDINANAFEGRGGIITINTDGIFGIDSRPEPTLLSDITASSEFGLPGTVTIQQPDVQPTQGTAELPNTFATPAIAQGCNATSATSRFVNTGRGGIPQNPTDSLTADAVWQDLEPFSPSSTSHLVNPTAATTLPPTAQTITEAQGWSRRSDGIIVLVAQAQHPTHHSIGAETNSTCRI